MLARDVPLSINIISLPYAGKDCLIAIGICILVKINTLFNPKLLPASIIPGFIVSKAEKVLSNNDDTKIEVKKAQGQKCERCWKILEKKCQRESCPIK